MIKKSIINKIHEVMDPTQENSRFTSDRIDKHAHMSDGNLRESIFQIGLIVHNRNSNLHSLYFVS